jgi:hypothetical protein
MLDFPGFDQHIADSISRGDLQQARSLVHQWLQLWASSLPQQPTRRDLRQPELWRSLALVVEHTNDHFLIERFWQILERCAPQPESQDFLPLLGIPILNRPDLLAQLLESLDHPVDHLAIVDNSVLPQANAGKESPRAPTEVQRYLEALCQLGHPLVNHVHVARPFRNLGVAASWNLILSSFPEARIALLANNDVRFAPDVLKSSLSRMDATRPQVLQLLPSPAGFSAFLLTALCWDRLGLFDPNFHPAYGEDLDYRDRIRANPEVEEIDAGFAHQAMLDLNPLQSATIASDPALFRFNQTSFALNRLWYFSHRRLRQDCRGTWRRLWLSQWSNDPDGEDIP